MSYSTFAVPDCSITPPFQNITRVPKKNVEEEIKFITLFNN